MSHYPLRGIRVIDLSRVWSGPVAGRQLADMGAEVIKVESHRRIDLVRQLTAGGRGKPSDYKTDHDSEVQINFENFNRNKLSVTLDLESEEACQIAKRLVGVSDVVVENFPPRIMKKWSLSYDELCNVNPSIIMISLSAAGQWGPLRDIMTYGPSLGGLAGLESVVGYDDNVPIGSHRDATDPLAAVLAAYAVLVAIRHRNRTGKGQYIDLSQWEASTCTQAYILMDWIMNKRNSKLIGNKHYQFAPCGCYRCRGEDKWVAIAVATQEHWLGFCRTLGDPEWTRDERFKDMRGRKLNEKELDRWIESWTSELEQYDVMTRLQMNGVPSAATLDTLQALRDPHFNSRELWTVPAAGNKLADEEGVIESPYWRLSRTQGGVYRAAPTLGRDQEYVLAELMGMSQAEITDLGKRGILY
ncbi:CaiB/BaiF CoA transferase family protein [Chloroflexota bacterium]